MVKIGKIGKNMKKSEKKPNRKVTTALFLVSVILIITLFSMSLVSAPIYNKDKNILKNIIKPIMDNTIIENGNCLSYTLYYKDLLKEIYPELDIRKIDLAGICPIGTKECGDMEGMPHTYLIINGYGGECILDQHKLVCIQVRY